jgi:hypothetical protein
MLVDFLIGFATGFVSKDCGKIGSFVSEKTIDITKKGCNVIKCQIAKNKASLNSRANAKAAEISK